MNAFERFCRWMRVKKLEWEVWDSERFQRECERLRCHSLAACEENHRNQIRARIGRLLT